MADGKHHKLQMLLKVGQKYKLHYCKKVVEMATEKAKPIRSMGI